MSGKINILGPDGRPISSVSVSPAESRNYAFSSVGFTQMPVATFNDWSVAAAVKDGYAATVWTYRAVKIIRDAATTAPFIVRDTRTGETLPNHKALRVLNNPNVQMSRKSVFSLIVAWMQLSGVAYLIKTVDSGRLQLWPASPDRIAAIAAPDQSGIVTGYASRTGANRGKKILEATEVLAFLLSNPANPIEGIGPLQAAAKVVDADTEQINWNYSAMRNRGVLDGFISFKDELDETQITAIEERLREKYSGSDNARKMGVFGQQATYTRIGLNAAEMDFIESRKQGRDEQLAAFGVPSQLANAQEAATYNNFEVAETMLWQNTIVPLLDTLSDAITFDFRNSGFAGDAALSDDEEVAADYSGIKALQRAYTARTEAAERLHRIGVPVSQLNKVLDLRLEEFENWDKPFAGVPQSFGQTQQVRNDPKYKLIEFRSLQDEFKKRETTAKREAKQRYAPLLSAQQTQLFAEVQQRGMADAAKAMTKILKEARPDWIAALTDHYIDSATDAGSAIVVEQRAAKSQLRVSVEEALDAEEHILRELSLIDAFTAERVLEQIDGAIASGMSVGELQQAIEDVGAFTPERALRISRTVTGAAGNLGQNIAAIDAGAQRKMWSTSGFGVRSQHAARDGEEVDIADEFTRVASSNGVHPQYPLDPRLAPEDRINCRCVLVFST